jgi:hypothetical protein
LFGVDGVQDDCLKIYSSKPGERYYLFSSSMQDAR